jgi:hypothetical protein
MLPLDLITKIQYTILDPIASSLCYNVDLLMFLSCTKQEFGVQPEVGGISVSLVDVLTITQLELERSDFCIKVGWLC